MSIETTLEEYVISVLTGNENEEVSTEVAKDTDPAEIISKMKRIRTHIVKIIDVILGHAEEPADVQYFTDRRASKIEEFQALREELDKAA